MTTGKIKRLFAAVLLTAFILMLSGCMLFASNKSFDTIRFDGREYTACDNTILLDYRLPGVTDWEDIRKTLLTEIGKKDGAAVYAIAGMDSGSWIYCDFEPMLGNGPRGLYHSSDVKMDTVDDFKPDRLEVRTLTPPTASGSGTEALYAITSDKTVIDNVARAILGGTALSPDALLEAQNKAGTYDNSKQYRLEFTSSAYPNLRYQYSYTVGKDGRCYVLADKAGYESDDKLLKLVDGSAIT